MAELFFAIMGILLGLSIHFEFINVAWFLGAIIVCGVALQILRRWILKKDGENYE